MARVCSAAGVVHCARRELKETMMYQFGKNLEMLGRAIIGVVFWGFVLVILAFVIASVI